MVASAPGGATHIVVYDPTALADQLGGPNHQLQEVFAIRAYQAGTPYAYKLREVIGMVLSDLASSPPGRG